MDFGTICSNLEKGNKYANSEEVYKDVQYIWDNCYKYNNKGAEGIQGEDVGASNQGPGKSGQSKQKNKRRHGRRHKADCLCAICVLKRRRREREESTRLAKTQIGVADYKLAQQLKQEDSSPVERPHHEDSLSDESLGADADVEEVEEKAQEVEEVSEQHDSSVGEKCKEGVKEDELEEEENEDGRNVMETQKELNSGAPEKSQVSQRSGEELNHQSQLEIAETAGPISQIQPQEQPAMEQQQEEVVAAEKNKRKELQERQTKVQIFEKFHFENPLLLSLCRTLFSEDRQSVWRGPHSLFQHQTSAGRSSIHAAINKLMK
uniref:Uncharacterized protein MANES_10G118700 n=1 Tax=Rhizophora mucronata TaxID=61149 RepID=A0A2P2K5Q1_RHIMU